MVENGEKSTKFFLNLEKYRATQGCLRTIIVNKKEINNSRQTNDALYNFYQTLFKEKLSISEECIQSFLDKVSLPKLNENQILKCEGTITECELLNALTSMDNEKSPGNDGITKEFYIKFWDAVNPIQDGWRGGGSPPPTRFTSVTYAKVGISPQKFLTFSFNPFAILV